MRAARPLPVLFLTGLLGAQTAMPAYEAVTIIVVNNKPSAVSAIDVNSDGKPDLVVTNAATHSCSLLINNGLGTAFARQDLALTAADREPMDLSQAFDSDNDAKQNDFAVVCPGSDTFIIVVNSLPQPRVTSVPLPGGLKNPVACAAGNNSNPTPILAVACAGRVFGGGGGIAVRVGNDPPVALTTTRMTYSRVAVGDLDGDGDQDIVGQGPGYLDLWEQRTQPSITFVAAGSITSGVLNGHVAIANVNPAPDTHLDIIESENSAFQSQPQTSLVIRLNSGSGPLAPERFSEVTKYGLEGSYVTGLVLNGGRFAGNIPGHRSWLSAYYHDAAGGHMRCTPRFDQQARRFDTTVTIDHEVGPRCSTGRFATADFDSNGLIDLAYVEEDNVEIRRAVPFPLIDAFGARCGTSTISSSAAPRLGVTCITKVVADQANRLVLHLVAADSGDTLIGPGCRYYLGPTLLAVGLGKTMAPGNDSALHIPVPSDRALLAAVIFLQGVVFRPGGAHAQVLDLTEGLRALVGDVSR